MTATPMVVAVVTAAGSGSRMGPGTPKQFLPIDGTPLLVHTLLALSRSPLIGMMVPVVPPEFLGLAAELISREPGILRVLPPVAGGARRQDSVRAGFEALPRSELVLVHDGARPLVTPAVIESCVTSARIHGAAVAAVPASDTVKLSLDGVRVSSTLDRRQVWLVQTPQVFRWELLRSAYDNLPDDDVTDEASLIEAAGHPVGIAAGDPINIKVTTPADIRLAAFLLGGTRREPFHG